MIFFSFIFLLRILKQGMTFGTAEPEGLGIKSSEGSLRRSRVAVCARTVNLFGFRQLPVVPLHEVRLSLRVEPGHLSTTTEPLDATESRRAMARTALIAGHWQ